MAIHLDQVAGAEHFRTTIQAGIRVMEALRGWTSGLANPHFVIDAPGGGGKIPLLREYVISMTDEGVVLRNFRGERCVYRQPQEELVLSRKRRSRAKRKTAQSHLASSRAERAMTDEPGR